MTPKEAFEQICHVSCDAELLQMAKFALYRWIPRFVLIPNGWEGVRKTRYYCPACKKLTRNHEKYCHSCGQAVKYPKLAHSTTEHKLFLDWSEKT